MVCSGRVWTVIRRLDDHFSQVGLAGGARSAGGRQVGDASCFGVNVAVVVAEVGGSAVCAGAWVGVLAGFSLEEHHARLAVEDALAEAVRFGDGVVPAVAQVVYLLVLAGPRGDVFCVGRELRNWKKRTERFGLKSAAPVPLCFETLYLPRAERASGSS